MVDEERRNTETEQKDREDRLRLQLKESYFFQKEKLCSQIREANCCDSILSMLSLYKKFQGRLT